ncbi:MAG: YihY family inner membrane protein [Verrucomicrobia bacterium]|jgi:membrane protein|nr:YihY family inner membrane protein [Verrucomicrobiota bacterium]
MDRKRPSRFKTLRAQAAALMDDRTLALRGEGRLSWPQRWVHFWVLVGRGFVRNRCPVRASALAYTTLLALIPLLAVGLGVSTGLLKGSELRAAEFIRNLVDQVAPQLDLLPVGREEKAAAQRAVVEMVPRILQSEGEEQTRQIQALADRMVPEVIGGGDRAVRQEARARVVGQIQAQITGLREAGESRRAELTSALVDDLLLWRSHERVVGQIQAFISNIHSGALGLTGTVFLIFIALGLLSNIETTFNDIWGVARGRSWLARVVQYWAAITLGPLLMVLALGLLIGGQLEAARTGVQQGLPLLGGVLVQAGTYLGPFLLLVGTFTLIYLLMPNTRVDWQAALVGGLVGGLLWQLNSQFNVLFAARVVRTSQIYGPLSAVPVFLLGLYFSWLILLFGAQVSYTFQNRRAYLQEKQAESVNQRGREFVALRLMTGIGRWFQRGHGPPRLSQLTEELGIPTRLAQQVLHPLVTAQLVVEVAGLEPAYAPARPLETINCHEVLRALRAAGGADPTLDEASGNDAVYGEFARIQEAEQRAAAAVTVLALVQRAPARPALEAARGEQEPSSEPLPPPPVEKITPPASATETVAVTEPAAPTPPAASLDPAPVIAQAATDDKQTFPL